MLKKQCNDDFLIHVMKKIHVCTDFEFFIFSLLKVNVKRVLSILYELVNLILSFRKVFWNLIYNTIKYRDVTKVELLYDIVSIVSS